MLNALPVSSDPTSRNICMIFSPVWSSVQPGVAHSNTEQSSRGIMLARKTIERKIITPLHEPTEQQRQDRVSNCVPSAHYLQMEPLPYFGWVLEQEERSCHQDNCWERRIIYISTHKRNWMGRENKIHFLWAKPNVTVSINLMRLLEMNPAI